MKKILKVDSTTFIKPEDHHGPFKLTNADPLSIGYWIWGFRYNKNERRYSKQCMAHRFKTFEWVDESELDPYLQTK